MFAQFRAEAKWHPSARMVHSFGSSFHAKERICNKWIHFQEFHVFLIANQGRGIRPNINSPASQAEDTDSPAFTYQVTKNDTL